MGHTEGISGQALQGAGFIPSGLLLQGGCWKLPLGSGVGEGNLFCIPLRDPTDWVSIAPGGKGRRRGQAPSYRSWHSRAVTHPVSEDSVPLQRQAFQWLGRRALASLPCGRSATACGFLFTWAPLFTSEAPSPLPRSTLSSHLLLGVSKKG